MKVLGANGLQYLITKLMGVDFIVEEGTSGIWTYRKWNSGKIELWGNEYRTGVTNYASYNSRYQYYVDVNYPFTLTSTINWQASLVIIVPPSSAQITVTTVTPSNVTNSYIRVYGDCPQGGSMNISTKIYLLGTWK